MRTRLKWIVRLLSGAAVLAAFVPAGPAAASFPGPDGRIAFVQGADVYTMRPDGTDLRQLTSLAPGGAAHASWSRNGRQLVFDVLTPAASAQLWLMNADGSHQRLLLDDPAYDDLDPSFSPDGANVTFSRCQTTDAGTCAIYRVATDGGALTALTTFDPGVIDFQSEYSPDGTTIAFGRFAFNGVFPTAGAVDLMNADGSDVRRLTPLALGAADPDWSPDGSRLVFTTHCCDPENAQLWTIRADGTQPAPLTASNDLHDFQPSWSPQGDAIAFERHAPSAIHSGIYVVRPDGTGLTMIERGGMAPRWGPLPEPRPSPGPATATLPSGNAAQQWNAIAQEAVVTTPGMFQNEALLYMAYVQLAVYDAVVSIRGGYRPYGPRIAAPHDASVGAAVVEAAYRTLVHYLPAQAATLAPAYTEALGDIADGPAKAEGLAVGDAAAAEIITLRADDGRRPVGTLTPYAPPASAGLASWEPTPPAFQAPQTPWLKDVRPFVLPSPDRFLPGPPPALDSRRWVDEYNEIRLWGRATGSPRTQEQTDIARFWTTNVIRQYNTAFRDLATGQGLDVLQTARLLAIGNVAGADAQIACWKAKYRYGFWRPVTAIASPGRDDGNPLTEKDLTWTPTVTTPNHPEYPAAHGCLTSAMAGVFSGFLHTNRIDVTLTSTTVPTMPTREFERAGDLRAEIVEARLWGGLHFRDSSRKGVALGRRVARYILSHAFERAGPSRARGGVPLTRVACGTCRR